MAREAVDLLKRVPIFEGLEDRELERIAGSMKQRTFNAGDSFVEMPGQTLQVFNRGSADLVLAATFLLPDGAQLTTNV